MANEDKKDFNAMLHDSKDMPKFQTITDEKSIEKYGGNKMYFAPPMIMIRLCVLCRMENCLLLGAIREYFANEMEPILQSRLQQEYLFRLLRGRAISVPRM